MPHLKKNASHNVDSLFISVAVYTHARTVQEVWPCFLSRRSQIRPPIRRRPTFINTFHEFSNLLWEYT